jgi:SAM-dependent methyltransferase
MKTTPPNNDEQTTLWNGPGGRAWVDAQVVLDGILEPFENLLVRAVSTSTATRVLDVGCGTGSTTLAVARLLGATGSVVGLDLSAPMIEAARSRAQREASSAQFVCADAQFYDFTTGSYDSIISRFGVMFFDDPIPAFANLRRAVRDGGELRVVAWRSASENPFMTTAERAAAPLLPDLPPRRPDAPGQFAFGDPQRVHTILEKSGWAEIEVRPIDVDCTLAEHDLVGYLIRLGPVGLTLQGVDDRTRTQVIETVRAAFDPYVHGAEVRFVAACWMIGARALAI